MDIKVRKLNMCQTEVVIDGKRIILTDLNKVQLKNKIKDAVLGLFVTVIFILGFSYVLYHELTTPYGYWAPDYVTEDGVLVDIDGDGDVYHWVDP